jgi:glyoxylase-like metal-dependent hydrolase (beta-lactamase superfamily II)
MAAQIPFVRDMDFAYGAPQQVTPLVRRVVSNNPGPFTFRGTGVYIIGKGEVAVIDPGPDQPGQLDMLKAALAGERVTHIFVTHGHLDHSPMARPLARATGATIYACGKPIQAADSDVRMEAGDDLGFRPDVAISDGDVFEGPGWTIEAVATPGHTSHHFAFALREEDALFTGDHIMGWSTTVISPPDGDMTDYLASLEKVRDRNFSVLWPTHGPPIRNVRPFVQAYYDHRLAREEQVLVQLRAGRHSIRDMVAIMYADVDKRLHPAACHSVLAHMIHLIRAGMVETDGAPTVDSLYRLRAA